MGWAGSRGGRSIVYKRRPGGSDFRFRSGTGGRPALPGCGLGERRASAGFGASRPLRHQTETAGYLGLVGFLAAFISLWLGQENIVWAALLANVGWALFGAASLGTRTYPRVAVILLIVGAVLAALVNILLAAIQAAGTTVAFVTEVGAIVDIIFYAGVAWMGFSLFTRRPEEARLPAS